MPYRALRCVALLPALILACPAVAPAQPGGKTVPGQMEFPFPVTFRFSGMDDFFKMWETKEEDRKALDAIPVSPGDERDMGRQLVETYLAEMQRRRIPVLKRGRDVDYLQSLVATLRPQMQNAKRYESLRILVLRTTEREARCFAGGTIVISTGLLDFVGDEATLVTILGHELSHLDRGHLLLPIRRMRLMQKTMQQTLQQGMANGFDPQAFLSAGPMLMRLTKPFRPEDEAQADHDGVTWAYRAGYDPLGLVTFFRRLETNEPGGQLPWLSMFRTHPFSRDRRTATEDRIAELERTEPAADLYTGRENLRRRVPLAEKRFAE